jgi:hypothetical protein
MVRCRLLMAVLVALTLAASAQAWDKGSHPSIARQALGILPEPLAQQLRQHQRELLWGVVEPDISRMDDHRLPLAFLRGASRPGGADQALARFARRAETLLDSGAPMAEVAVAMGQAARFAQDLSVPLHTIRGETRAQHAAFESAAFFVVWQPDRFPYPGFALVVVDVAFAREIAEASHPHTRQALQDPPPAPVIALTWHHAVHDTADLWQSIVVRALGPEASRARYGIPAPRGRRGAAPISR